MNSKHKIKFWTGIFVLAIAVLITTALQANAHGPPRYNDLQLDSSNEVNGDYWGHMMEKYMGCH